MNYYKTDTSRWGKNETKSFYNLVLSENIVFCAGEIQPAPGDIIAITSGFTIIALAIIQSSPYPITSNNSHNLKDKVAEYNISYEEWNTIADVTIQQLDKEDYIKYPYRKGISQIKKSFVVNKINKLLNRIELEWKYTMDNIADLLCNVGNLVLTGAPGCGKTYIAKEIALEIVENEDSRIGFCQFHPSFDYTDFIEGLRPIRKDGDIVFQRKDGIFKSFCKRALEQPEAKYIFIIDEINRGDISKIFGELFFSIDKGYRGKKGRVATQYQNLIENTNEDPFGKGFYVPDNVYILGTMNDIDRSVESMDFAIRRRFTWYEITCEVTAPIILENIKDENVRNLALNRMKNLNAQIRKIDGLSSSYDIGASYFLHINDYNGDFELLWKYHIKGLLAEYLRGSKYIEQKLTELKEAYDNEKKNTDN